MSGANAFRCVFIIKYFLISKNVIFVRAEREESRIAFERNAKLNLGLGTPGAQVRLVEPPFPQNFFAAA